MLPWAAALLVLLRLRRLTPSLDHTPPLGDIPLSIILPARNEAANIEAVVHSILQSSYPSFELIVVDDQSTDDTAERALATGGADPRFRLVRGVDPPSGWFGKPWACRQGSQVATGELLLFTDADTWHHPALHGRAVGELVAQQADMLSILGRQDCVTFWEQVVMPQVTVPLGLRYHPERINRARHARDLVANGQFILVRREAYRSAGTHEAVRHEVAEDLRLAQAFFRTGHRVRVVFALDSFRTRMYSGLAHLVEGWTKNVYLGGRASFPDSPVLQALVPVALLANTAFWITPLVWLVLSPDPRSLAGYGFGVLFWLVVSLGMGTRPWTALLYPLGAAAMGYITVRSLLRGGRRVEWKGRTYAPGAD